MTDFTMTRKWVYVVSQNDFPAAVFSDAANARAFIERQPKRTINGKPIYWHMHKFQLDEGPPCL